MNKLFIFSLVVAVLLIATTVTVSAYYCIRPQEDNEAVQQFKQKLNTLALKEDLKEGLSKEAIETKLKYFNPCS